MTKTPNGWLCHWCRKAIGQAVRRHPERSAEYLEKYGIGRREKG